MTGADKVVCQAATLLLLFTLTTMPARAQFGGLGGGGGGDMMTQMAPMLEMMKARMGKRRFGMMMQTMGPMMGQMMEGGGLGSMTAWRRFQRHRHDGRRRRRRHDEHDSAADADGQCRRRPPAPSAAVLVSLVRTMRGGYPAPGRPSVPIA